MIRVKVEDVPNVFWERVNILSNNRCWEWQSCMNKSGYGRFNNVHIGSCLAHRFAFFLHNGYLPHGRHVCHTCDNPKCVNPYHLYDGTAKDNQADFVKRNGKRIRKKNVINAKKDDFVEYEKTALKKINKELQ